MSRLQWNGVTAPDFSTSLDGVRTAGSFLNQAFQNAGQTIEGVDNDISSRVNKAVLAQLAGISDADGAEAQIQQLLAGVDPRRLSTETIQFGAARPDALIGRESDRFNLETSRYTQGRTVDNNQRMDDNEGLLRSFYEAAATNDGPGMEKARAALVSSSLRASQFENAIGNAQGIRSGDLGIDRSELGLTQDRYGFGRQQMTDADNDAATSVFAEIQKLGLFTVEDAAAYASTKKLSPRAYSAVMARISPLEFVGSGSAGGGGGPSGMGGGGGSNADPYNTTFGFGKYGQPPKPLTEMSMGEVYDWGQNTLRPATRAAGFGKTSDGSVVGTSAVGAYQFVGGTMAKYAEQVLGKDWRNAQFTPETQDKMAEALFNDTKGGNLKKTWEGLPDSRPGAYANLTWPEMREQIFKHEVGATPEAMAALSGAGGVARAQKVDQITGDPVIDNYLPTVGKSSSVLSVASRLTGEGGIFAGADKQLVESRLREVTAQATEIAKKAGKTWTPNADQAALLLENSVGTRSWTDWAGDGLSGLVGPSSIGGRSIDQTALKANVLKIAGGAAEETLNSQNRAAFVEQRNAQVQQRYDAQLARVQGLMSKPGVNPQIIARERGMLAMLEKELMSEVPRQVADGDAVSRVGNKAEPWSFAPQPGAGRKLPSAGALDIRSMAKQKPAPARGSSAASVSELLRLAGK